MKEVTFRGVVIATPKVISIIPDARYKPLINKRLPIAESHAVQVTIGPVPDEHSDAQRRLFHKLCSIYAREHNSTKADVKWMAKCEWGVTREVEVKGERYLLVKSTSEYTMSEYRALIDGLINHMLDDGIEIDAEYIEWRGLR